MREIVIDWNNKWFRIIMMIPAIIIFIIILIPLTIFIFIMLLVRCIQYMIGIEVKDYHNYQNNTIKKRVKK